MTDHAAAAIRHLDRNPQLAHVHALLAIRDVLAATECACTPDPDPDDLRQALHRAHNLTGYDS